MFNIYFTLSEENHLPILHEWLQNDHVREYWDDGDRTLEQVKLHYKNENNVKRYIFTIEGKPAGYLQTYVVDRDNEYYPFSLKNKITLGIDYFIGDPRFLNQGYAIQILSKFIENHCLAVDRVLVDPQPSNEKAIHIYKKYGFAKISEKIINDKLHLILGINLRRTVRAVVLNSESKILLMQIETWPELRHENEKSRIFWCTLGGRLEKKETIEDALKRELFEEAGITAFSEKLLAFGEQVLILNDFPSRLIESFYVVEVGLIDLNTTNLTEEEKAVIKRYHWWTIEELANTKETIFPGCLAQLASQYILNRLNWIPHEIDLN